MMKVAAERDIIVLVSRQAFEEQDAHPSLK